MNLIMFICVDLHSVKFVLLIIPPGTYNWIFYFVFYSQEIASSFSGGGARGYEYGPAFVPGEICRRFRSAGEKFVNLV